MLEVNDRIHIPDEEFHWSFVRSGGPGGQNVNKVASKAMLRWDLANSFSLPEETKARLRTLQRRRIALSGELIITGQRFRDQERNRQDCLDKLKEMIQEAATLPRPRKPTRVTRGAREARLASKRHRAASKQRRRQVLEE